MVAMARAMVCLSLCLAVCQIRCSYVSSDMNRTIQDLLQHYNVPRPKIFNGEPVFSKGPLSGKLETKMLYMGGVLETYEKLIDHMLKQLPTPSPQTSGATELPSAAAVIPPSAGAGGGDVRRALMFILGKIQNLKARRYQEQENLLQSLRALRHVQVDNVVVQNKALMQLPLLYEVAGSLPGAERMQQQRRRRRRQAQRVKSHPRV